MSNFQPPRLAGCTYCHMSSRPDWRLKILQHFQPPRLAGGTHCHMSSRQTGGLYLFSILNFDKTDWPANRSTAKSGRPLVVVRSWRVVCPCPLSSQLAATGSSHGRRCFPLECRGLSDDPRDSAGPALWLPPSS